MPGSSPGMTSKEAAKGPPRGGQWLGSADAGADRAGDARAAEPAIAVRVLGEILLVIVLGEIERRRVDDLGSDRPVALLLQVACGVANNLDCNDNVIVT